MFRFLFGGGGYDRPDGDFLPVGYGHSENKDQGPWLWRFLFGRRK